MHQKVPVLLLHPPIVPLSEDSIFNAPGCIGGQAGAFTGIKRGDALDQPDGSDGNEVLLVGSLGVVLFIRMKQKDTIFP